MYRNDLFKERNIMGDDLLGIEEILCICRFEDDMPMTRSERLADAFKILGIAILTSTVVALASIGMLDVWLSLYLS